MSTCVFVVIGPLGQDPLPHGLKTSNLGADFKKLTKKKLWKVLTVFLSFETFLDPRVLRLILPHYYPSVFSQ